MITKHDRFGYEIPARTSQAQMRGAVRLVLDHFLQAELEDWKQTPRDQKDSHIYPSLKVLKNWMGEQEEMLRNRASKKKIAGEKERT